MLFETRRWGWAVSVPLIIGSWEHRSPFVIKSVLTQFGLQLAALPVPLTALNGNAPLPLSFGPKGGICSFSLSRGYWERALQIPPLRSPDFLFNLVALMNFMCLSLRRGAHVDMSGAAWQEIRVRFGRRL